MRGCQPCIKPHGGGGVQRGESEFSLIAEKSANYNPRWGAGLSQGIGEQWTLYGEYLISRDRDMPILKQTRPEIPLVPGTELSVLYEYRRDETQKNWQKLLLTLRYYPQVGGSVEGSLFYNGHGLDRREWSSFPAVPKNLNCDISLISHLLILLILFRMNPSEDFSPYIAGISLLLFLSIPVMRQPSFLPSG